MIVKNASVDVTTYFVLRDSTNHAPKTDVTITDIDLYYVEEGAAISAKTDATALAAADSAHADGKAFHVGNGLYRIDWADAAFDGGAGKKVILVVVCTGVDTTFLEVLLSPSVTTETVNDKTGYALTAAYDAAKTAADATALATVDTVVDAIKAKTDNLPASPAAVGSAMTLTAAYDAAKTAAQAGDKMDLVNAPNATAVAAIQNGLATAAALAVVAAYIDTEVAAILAAVDTEVAAIKAKTDNLPASPAATGDAMTLTAAYDAAKTAAQAGDAMTLTAAYDAAKTAAQAGDAMLLTAAYDAAKTAASAAEVASEISDALNVDAQAEPGSVPAATAAIAAKLSWLFLLARNKRTQTGAVATVHSDAGAAVGTAATADDGMTFTQDKWA